MAYKETRVDIVFNADTKKAKAAMQDLQGSLNALMKANLDFNLGESITKEVKESQQALLQLSQSLKNATNVDTGKLDLSRFKEQMDAGGMSIKKYYDVLTNMGPAGEQAFSKLALQIQKAEIPLKRTGKLANELWTTLKNTARWQLSASLLQGFTGAIQKAFRYSQDLNKSLNDIRIVTGASVEDMSRFAIEANKSAKALSATTNEYAKASLIYFQQGLSDAEVKERTDVTIKMANVSRESAETVSDQMTAVWNNFADGSRTLEYYADVMTALGAATASSTAEITTGLEKFAAVAETVGLSYEYATTALATITDTTRQSADVVGNALKTLFARIQGLSLGETLEDGTDLTKYSEALMKVGISIKEQDGSLREMDDILDDMASKWQTLNKDQQVALAQTVAGVRQYTQLVALMDNWDKFEMNLEVAEGAEGALQEQADIYAESWEAASDRATAALEAIYEKLLDDEFLVDLIDGFTGFLELVDNLIDNLGGLPGVLALVGAGFTKIFNKQLATGINNTIYSLKMSTKSGRESIVKEKVTAADFLAKKAETGGTPADNKRAEAYKKQSEEMKKFLAINESLTEEQREQYQLLLDMQATQVARVADASLELQDLTVQNERHALNVNAQVKDIYNNDKSTKSNVHTFERSSRGAQKAMIFEADLKLLKPDDKNLKSIKEEIKNKLKDIPTNITSNEQQKQFKSKITGDKYVTGVSEAEKALSNLKEMAEKSETSVDELKIALSQVSSGIDKDLQQMNTSATLLGGENSELERETREVTQSFQQERQAAQELNKDLQKVHGISEVIADSQEELGQKTMDAGTKITYTAEIASSLTMGVTSLIGTIQTLKDDDLSGWEKLSSVLTTASFTVPMLITSLGKAKELMAASSGFQSLLAFVGGGWQLAAVLAVVAAAVWGLTQAWKKAEEQMPEAQLEKAKEEAKSLNEALEKTKTEIDEINNLFGNYDNAKKALEECTKGTKAWYEALENVNDSALSLLEKYPELYDSNKYPGAIDTTGDYTVIDPEAIEQIIQQRRNVGYSTQVALLGNKQKQNELDYDIGVEDLRAKANNAGLYVADPGEDYDGFKIVKDLAAQNITDLESIRAVLDKNHYAGVDEKVIQDLVKALQGLESKVEEGSKAIDISSQIYSKNLLSTNKKVQESDNKKYIENIVGKQLEQYQNEAKNDLGLTTDEDIFAKYKAEFGISESAQLNSKGQVMLDGEEIATVASMTAALTADEVAKKANAEAKRQLEIFSSGNAGKIGQSIYEATGDLGELNLQQIEEYRKLLGDNISEELKQQFEDIGEIDIDDSLKSLSVNLATGLQKTLGGEVGPVGAIIEDLGTKGAQLINSIDWSNWDADDIFKEQLEQTGLSSKITAEEIELLTPALKDSNNAVKAFDSNNWSKSIKETSEALEKIDVGSIIEEEDLVRFKQIDTGFGEYFTKMADGTYMLTKDAEEFYALVRNAQLNEVKEAIQSNEVEINRLRSEAEKAAHDGKDELADSYNAQADALAAENPILQFQGLSMARSGEEFDEMANEDEFKTLDKTSESYQRLRNEIIETEEERGKEVETLGELNKLRNKGEIGNRGYAAGLTKLAKQYPQLNKKVNEYEEAIVEFGKDSEEAASALNDLSEAMSAAQWKTAAQDLYDARYEIRELKAEYGALADEMPEYQQALQDQADALTALFGVEVSPAFADAHADKIDEYLAGSQKAGYELMWLAEQQSGHIETVVNEYLASTGASAEQIQNVITALDGLSFDIDGTADMTQVIESLLATGATGEQVAKMLNALGSSHIQFEVSSEGWKTMEELTEEAAKEVAESGFMGGRKKTLELVNNLATQRYKAQLNITTSGTVPKVDEFELSTVSGKNKGGGSKGTKKVASDEKERFHVITKQIDSATAALEDYEKKRERAFGPLKNTYMDEEIAKTKNLISLQEQYIAEIKDYLASDEPEIKKYGAIIDADSGVITNYDEMMDKQIAIYNEAIEKAGTNEKAQEAAEKAYELFIKALENYEETYATYLDELSKLQDLQNEKIDKELEHIQDRLDAKLELEADQLTYLDYLIGKLDDEAFALADALVSLHDKTQPIMNQSDHYAQAWEELQRTAKENGGWTQDMIDKLRELRDGLISTNEEIMELQKTIEEKVNEAISECTDELDKQINRFDTYQNILQNYNDIIDLSGKKFKDYAMMLELSSLMTDNAINKLASSREKLETLGQAQINAQAKLELAEDSGDQDVIDYWKKTLEDIQIEVENATAEMGSAWKEALQAASDAFESQVNLAIDNFKGGLEAFGDLDMISESYDRAEKAAERYLEDFEKTHELSQLGRDITKAMNDTTSAFAKEELAKLMAEVNEKQKDGVKMSEYDLEVLKKKFELKQAELALEEAQNSMSQVRLTRDNEGNWSYQYTADQDKIDEALSEYEARLYEIAKLSDEYIDEMSKAVIDNQKEMYETLAGLRAEDFASYEEYEAKVREIVNFYTTQDAYLRDELAKAVGDTEYVTTTMSGHYDNLSTSFTTVVDTMLGNTGDKTGNLKTWMESTDNLAEQAEEYFNTELPKAYKAWEESVDKVMEAAGTNTEDFKDDVSGYMEDIGDSSEELADDIGDAADDMQDYIEDVMDAVWDWQEEYVEAIREMIAENEELIQSMMAVAAAQGAGGGDGDVSDYSLKIAELISQGATMDSEEVQKWLKKRANKTTQGGIYDEDNANIISNDQLEALMNKYVSGDEEAVALVDKVVKGQAWLTDDVVSKIVGFATGGYTGAWGPEGKIAMVHEKELVLNSDDTVNFLAGINILREIAKMIDLQAANMAMPHGFTLPMSASSGGALEQNVHISASFPGVQDRNEIEIALRSLVNEASQFVLE